MTQHGGCVASGEGGHVQGVTAVLGRYTTMTTTNPRDINDTTAESASDGVYHVVCHDCTLEAVCDNDAPARQLVDGHSHHYGHDVECQRVTDPRGGQR